MSYIGVFDARPFDDYYFLAEKLKEYVSMVQLNGNDVSKNVLKRLEVELIDGIRELATPTSIKIM